MDYRYRREGHVSLLAASGSTTCLSVAATRKNPCDVDCFSTGLSRCLTISHRDPCFGELNMEDLIGSGWAHANNCDRDLANTSGIQIFSIRKPIIGPLRVQDGSWWARIDLSIASMNCSPYCLVDTWSCSSCPSVWPRPKVRESLERKSGSPSAICRISACNMRS